MKVLTLVRGLPGSGKSTLAAKLSSNTTVHFEADQFFVADGKYTFDGSKLKEAHEWCQSVTRNALDGDCSVVVSNTFTELWEMQPYIDMADKFGAKLNVIECHGSFGSIHSPPEEVLARMRARWTNWAHDNSRLISKIARVRKVALEIGMDPVKLIDELLVELEEEG